MQPAIKLPTALIFAMAALSHTPGISAGGGFLRSCAHIYWDNKEASLIGWCLNGHGDSVCSKLTLSPCYHDEKGTLTVSDGTGENPGFSTDCPDCGFVGGFNYFNCRCSVKDGGPGQAISTVDLNQTVFNDDGMMGCGAKRHMGVACPPDTPGSPGGGK